MTSRWARIVVGSTRARADRIARSGHESRGRLTCRRSTATSWRNASNSAVTAASLRASAASQPNSRTVIKYSSRRYTTGDHASPRLPLPRAGQDALPSSGAVQVVLAPLRHRPLDRCREPRYRGLWRLPGPDSHRLVALSLSTVIEPPSRPTPRTAGRTPESTGISGVPRPGHSPVRSACRLPPKRVRPPRVPGSPGPRPPRCQNYCAARGHAATTYA